MKGHNLAANPAPDCEGDWLVYDDGRFLTCVAADNAMEAIVTALQNVSIKRLSPKTIQFIKGA